VKVETNAYFEHQNIRLMLSDNGEVFTNLVFMKKINLVNRLKSGFACVPTG
jgi:hypothetical protein